MQASTESITHLRPNVPKLVVVAEEDENDATQQTDKQ